jgi:hypothetical protein
LSTRDTRRKNGRHPVKAEYASCSGAGCSEELPASPGALTLSAASISATAFNRSAASVAATALTLSAASSGVLSCQPRPAS